MTRQEVVHAFDKQAGGYDSRWKKLSPIRDAMLQYLDSLLSGLPNDARILCVGVGTGAELVHLSNQHPEWTFTAVDPSRRMLEVCKANAIKHGIEARCSFWEGYLETVPNDTVFDAATCFLVSQFILDVSERIDFFRDIAERLVPGGVLASSDLSADVEAPEFDILLAAWARLTTEDADLSTVIARMHQTYRTNVAVLPASEIEGFLKESGFDSVIRYYQVGLINGWLSRKPFSIAV